MIKMYFLCCAYRTRIKDHGIIKLRIAGLDKQINHSTRICIPIADWDHKASTKVGYFLCKKRNPRVAFKVFALAQCGRYAGGLQRSRQSEL